MHWLLRAKRWVKHPPSAARVKFVVAVVALCLVFVAIERMGYWPEWASGSETFHRLPRVSF